MIERSGRGEGKFFFRGDEGDGDCLYVIFVLIVVLYASVNYDDEVWEVI